VVPRTLSSYGDRTFAAAGSRLWNSLPVQLRDPDIAYGLFRRRLKGHLFWMLEHSALRKTFTYLLLAYSMPYFMEFVHIQNKDTLLRYLVPKSELD